MRILLASVIGPVCVSQEDGVRVFETIFAALRSRDTVDLDFAGVTTLTSSFLNRAYGRLFGLLPAEHVDAHIRFENLESDDRALLDLVRQNSIRFYQANPDQQQRLSDAAVKPPLH